MSQAVLSYDFRQVESLQKALSSVGTQSLSPLLRSLAMEVEEQTRERFQTKEGPEAPWPDWSEDYALHRAGSGGSLLQRSNSLLDSLTHQLGGDSVEVGSNKAYAATHQYGDKERGIPARPYLGINTKNEADLLSIVNDYLGGIL